MILSGAIPGDDLICKYDYFSDREKYTNYLCYCIPHQDDCKSAKHFCSG